MPRPLINAWTASGEIGVVRIEAPTIREAVGKFFEDCEARKLGWEAMRKYPVPPVVVATLGKIENGSVRYFWTGNNIRSAVSNWSRYLGRVFELANIKDHSHRFRDTCA